jgi:hypothetical protein
MYSSQCCSSILEPSPQQISTIRNCKKENADANRPVPLYLRCKPASRRRALWWISLCFRDLGGSAVGLAWAAQKEVLSQALTAGNFITLHLGDMGAYVQ